jgi:hypothetical protein
MIIRIDANGPSLDDAENFHSFKVVVEAAAGDREAVEKAVAGILQFEGDEHAWVEICALENWPGHGENIGFRTSLQAMIVKAKPFGWIAEDGRSIRAHIDWL